MPAKTSVVSTTPRKRRSRKPAAKVIPTEKTVVVTNEPKVVPPAPKLTFADYREDFQARVKVHNYEFNLFVKDLQKGYDFALPFGKKAVNFVSNLVSAE